MKASPRMKMKLAEVKAIRSRSIRSTWRNACEDLRRTMRATSPVAMLEKVMADREARRAVNVERKLELIRERSVTRFIGRFLDINDRDTVHLFTVPDDEFFCVAIRIDKDGDAFKCPDNTIVFPRLSNHL